MSGLVSGLVGIQTQAAQPCVSAFNSASDADVTGNGATATIDFDTEIFDQNSDFASDTFAAPITGRYLVIAEVQIFEIAAAMTSATINIVSDSRTWSHDLFDPGNMMDPNGSVKFDIAAIIDMDANDSFTITVIVYNGASDAANVTGNGTTIITYVSIELVA